MNYVNFVMHVQHVADVVHICRKRDILCRQQIFETVIPFSVEKKYIHTYNRQDKNITGLSDLES